MRRRAWGRAKSSVADRRAYALGLVLLVTALAVIAWPAGATADPLPPTVSLTSPTSGSPDLRSVVTLTADATAGTNPIDHVEFYYDDPNSNGGNPYDLGGDSTAPYSFTFDTTSVPNCESDACSIYAVGVDTQSVQGESSHVPVGVHNPIVVDPNAGDGSDNCSLRNAIASATNNDSEGNCLNGLAGSPDTIEVSQGTYDLNSELEISSDLNIVGAGAHSVTIQAPSTDRAFEIDGSANVGISGVTILGGRPTGGAGGGIQVDSGGSLSLQGVIVSGGSAIYGGGIENEGSLTVDGSTIENNSAIESGNGGGIDDVGSSLSITNSTIMNNGAAGAGGGLYLAGMATLTNDTVANNNSQGNPGGGIAVDGSIDPHIIYVANTIVAGNRFFESTNNCSVGLASLGGNLDDDGRCGFDLPSDQSDVADAGLGSVDQTGPTDVLPLDAGSPAIDKGDDSACPTVDQRYVVRAQASDCDIGAYEYTANPPTNYDVSTVPELNGVVSLAEGLESPATIQLAAGHYDIGNLIGDVGTGAGLEFEGAGSATTILDGNGMSNRVFDIGGDASTPTTIKSVTVENSSDTGIDDNGDLALFNSVIRDNPSLGISSTGFGLDISGSTISDNGDAGPDTSSNGGIYSSFTPVTISNSTISGNNSNGIYPADNGVSEFHLKNVTIADNPGAGIAIHAPIDAVNTIVADNGGGDCLHATENMTTNGHNLDSDGSCTFTAPGDLPGTDPRLGPLQDNGGPTPTMALLAGSPAIDAGDDSSCPAVDQRGITRHGAHCDIGAFEFVPSGSIAFESNRTGNSQIWTMNPDGSNLVQLTHDASNVTDTLPSISPDGHTVVYESNASGTNQIWAINGDGTDPRQLTADTDGSNVQPTFSPDGTKIAFDSNRNGNFQLFVMNADGSSQTQVTHSNGDVGGSSWSPDGSQVAVNDDSIAQTNQIYTVDVATGTETGPLTTIGANRNPHWSPDGSKILYASTNCSCVENVFVMNADGTNQHDVTQGGGFDTDPAWSPDGSQIAFLRDTGSFYYNIFTANADGSNQTQRTFATMSQRNSFPNWGTQVTAADLVVNTTADSDDQGGCTPALCSLRDAINAANTAGGGTITFDIPGGPAPTITLTDNLPTITAPVTIDGTTQPATPSNTPGVTIGNNGNISQAGVELGANSDGSVVRGLAIRGISNDSHDGSAIRVDSNNDTVVGNWVNTSADGTTQWSGDRGIVVTGQSDTIGGTSAADANSVVNTGPGILLSGATGTVIEGNLVGLTPDGSALGNQTGIELDNASTSVIGGTTAGARNVISANAGDGVSIENGSTGNTIVGNRIGTTADGTSQLANGGDGVNVASDGNTIGGTGNGDGNVISGNLGDGVLVHSATGVTGTQVVGNFIGVDAGGTNALPNGNIGVELDNTDTTTVQGNVVSGNGWTGVQVTGSATGTKILGNRIGTTADGNGALGNTSAGIYLGGVQGTTIGGSNPGDGNVISGNDVGIDIGSGATGTTISGNNIGTNANGTAALPGSGQGIVDSGDGTLIGGLTAGDRNLISGNPGDGIGVSDSGGATIEGNWIGVDSTGSSALPNGGDGINVSTTGNTIGGAATGARNTIAFNSGSGVHVTSGDENVISRNSIHDNTGLGIKLDNGTNQGIAAPTITSVAGNQASGTFTGFGAGDMVTLEFFGNASCNNVNGAGRDYLGSTQVPSQGGTTNWNATLSGLGSDTGVTATATDETPDTSEFSNCSTVGGGGTLSGTLSTSGQQSADLTAAGTQDWALWGYAGSGTSTSLAPDVRKAGGSGISSLTSIDPSGAPLRGIGQFGSGALPFTFDWSDGTSPSSVTAAVGGLQHDGQTGTVGANGDGFSFTVPADTAQRTLTVYTSEHWGTGTLTATLSDGSAQPYTDSVIGTSSPDGGNAPGVFTINYAAASAGQHLTVTWVETAANCLAFGCDNAAIYAVTLAGSNGSSVSSASATLNSDSNVPMSGSVVPTADIPLGAFDPQPPGAPPLTAINGLQLANTQLANTQLANTQLANTQLANTQLANTQLANTQLANTQLANTQLANTQLANTQLANTQLANTQLANTQLAHTQLANTGLTLDTLPLNTVQFPGGWAGLLQGTTLAGQPLQTVSLHDVLALTAADVPNPPAPESAQDVINKLQGLDFANIALPSSSLGQITVGSLALGGALVNQLGGDLESNIESGLHDWCLSFVASSGAPSGFCDGSDPGEGYLSLIQLGLLGAPVDSLQLANTQLANTQLANTQLANTQLANTQLANTQLANTPLSTSASGIVGMQLAHTDLTSGYGIGSLLVSNLPAATQDALFDCSNPGNFNCATGNLAQAKAAGAIKPTATVGDLDQGGFLDQVTIAQLLATVLGPNSAYQDYVNFGDLVGLFLRNSDVQWESLSPDVLAIFDPQRPAMSMTANFSVQGTGTPSADVKVDLPLGFTFVPGSASLTESENAVPSPGDPTPTYTANGVSLDWHFDSLDPGQFYALTYKVYGGTTVGPTQATETITSGGKSNSSIRPFSVTDSFPGNDKVSGAPSIDATPGNDSVEMSTLPTAGAVDYYTIPMPAAGTRIQVHLTNLPADYDLALYSPRTTSVRTTSNVAPPLQDGIVPDTQVNLNGGSSGQLGPTGLEDIPNPGIPLVQRSDNRGTEAEDVGMVSPGGGGVVTIAVYGYNGAFSPDAYTLRVRETPPQPTQVCPARSFQYKNTAAAGQTIDSLQANLASIPANVNTIVLVNEKRLGDTYGYGAEQTTVAALDHFAAHDQALGVSGVVVPVEQIAGVQGLYDTWDGNPCDPNAANAVANAIADEVDSLVSAHPSIKYVVFGGGDDQIPFFRLPDLSLIANESGSAFAGLGANEYGGAVNAGDLLSDDPYLDTQPIPASGQQLFPPNLAGGRLVETAQDITNAISSFEGAGGSTPGTLKSSTGFVSGYDFVADGSQSVADNLRRNGVTVQTLDNPLSATSNWGAPAFLAAAFPAGGPADINSWNGHYDNTQMQMANGDILATSGTNGIPSSLNGGVFFTMGCHAGFQTTDAVVGSTVLDWPEYMARHDTGFVGNTGFGLGDTDSVAFSEALMADFAGQLTQTSTLGNALMQAKQQYYLSRVAFSNYDEKALSEAELYGLPMYGIGNAPAPLHAALLSSPDPTPVTGTSASTSPSQGTLSSFPGTSVQSADFSAKPTFTGPITGQNGQYYTNAGQVQAPNYRPLQPYVSLPAGRPATPGLYAHGVVIDTLTSEDHSPFAPDNVRPTLNSSADEPPPSFTDESWPEKIPTLASLGQNQNLNLATGQFFTQTSGSTTTGVERLWTQINGQVTYSTSQDYTPPTIDSIDAIESDPGHSDDILGFTGRFSDLDQNGHAGTVVFAQVVYDDGTGHWQSVQLQQNSTGVWSAGVPFTGTHVQYFVEACDAAGNCGYSSNKGDYFDAQALPTGTGSGGSSGSLTISPSSNVTPVPWYTGDIQVSALSTAQNATVSLSVDGGAPTAGPVTLHGDGVHIVVARDSAGNVATASYLIDTTGPTITPTVSPAAPDGTNGWYKTAPTVTFNCSDNLSGVAKCLANGGPGNQVTLGNSATNQTVIGTAKDNAGNQSAPDTVTVTKIDSTPPATPTFNGITGGATYKPSDVPGTVSCSSSDMLSGLAGCVVTGLSTALGPHTLTATATDNAGNTSTATLNYTVAKATPTITWPAPSSIVYGTALSGTQLNATSGGVAGTFVYSPAAGTVLHAGASQTLSVTFNPTDTTDYTQAVGTQHITVTKATPTITWPAPSAIVYGTALSGTQLNATSGGVAGTFVYSPAAGTVLHAGASQTLSVTFNPTDTTDYTQAVGTQHITVTKATPTITWPAPSSIVYGTALSGTQLNATSGGVAGTFVYSPAAGTVLHAGASQTLSVTFNPTDTTDYTQAVGTQHITVTQANPTITWNPPTTIVFGTVLSSTQLNAAANVPGSFQYIPPAGTLLQPGPQQLSLVFTPTDTTDYMTTATSRSVTVGFSQSCLTGGLSGNLTVKSGTAYCIQGGKVSGSVTVQSGASLYVSGGSISGAVTSTGATAFSLCGSSVSGPVSVSGSTGLVLMGGQTGCAADKISGAVTFSQNKAGVNAAGNSISGAITATGNSGGFVFSGNTVSGGANPLINISGNSGGVTFTNNTVSGSVSITNNTGGFSYSGNKISGTVTLKNNT